MPESQPRIVGNAKRITRNSGTTGQQSVVGPAAGAETEVLVARGREVLIRIQSRKRRSAEQRTEVGGCAMTLFAIETRCMILTEVVGGQWQHASSISTERTSS